MQVIQTSPAGSGINLGAGEPESLKFPVFISLCRILEEWFHLCSALTRNAHQFNHCSGFRVFIAVQCISSSIISDRVLLLYGSASKEKLLESGVCLEEGIGDRTQLKTSQKCKTNHSSPHPQVLTHSTIRRRHQHQPAFPGLPGVSKEFCSWPYLCLEHLHVLALCSLLRSFQPRGAVRGLSHPSHSSTDPSPALQRGQERLNVPQTEGEPSQTQAEQQQTVKLLKQIGVSPCFVTQRILQQIVISPTNQP